MEVGESIESREGRKTRAAKTVCEKEGSTNVLENNTEQRRRRAFEEEGGEEEGKLGAWSLELKALCIRYHVTAFGRLAQ